MYSPIVGVSYIFYSLWLWKIVYLFHWNTYWLIAQLYVFVCLTSLTPCKFNSCLKYSSTYINRDKTVRFACVTSFRVEGKQTYCSTRTLPTQELRQRATAFYFQRTWNAQIRPDYCNKYCWNSQADDHSHPFPSSRSLLDLIYAYVQFCTVLTSKSFSFLKLNLSISDIAFLLCLLTFETTTQWSGSQSLPLNDRTSVILVFYLWKCDQNLLCVFPSGETCIYDVAIWEHWNPDKEICWYGKD
jgi:hypothetical protein